MVKIFLILLILHFIDIGETNIARILKSSSFREKSSGHPGYHSITDADTVICDESLCKVIPELLVADNITLDCKEESFAIVIKDNNTRIMKQAYLSAKRMKLSEKPKYGEKCRRIKR